VGIKKDWCLCNEFMDGNSIAGEIPLSQFWISALNYTTRQDCIKKKADNYPGRTR